MRQTSWRPRLALVVLVGGLGLGTLAHTPRAVAMDHADSTTPPTYDETMLREASMAIIGLDELEQEANHCEALLLGSAKAGPAPAPQNAYAVSQPPTTDGTLAYEGTKRVPNPFGADRYVGHLVCTPAHMPVSYSFTVNATGEWRDRFFEVNRHHDDGHYDLSLTYVDRVNPGNSWKLTEKGAFQQGHRLTGEGLIESKGARDVAPRTLTRTIDPTGGRFEIRIPHLAITVTGAYGSDVRPAASITVSGPQGPLTRKLRWWETQQAPE